MFGLFDNLFTKEKSGHLKYKRGHLKGKRGYISGPIENAPDPLWFQEPVHILENKFKIDLLNPFEDEKQQWVPDLLAARENKDYEKMKSIAKDFVHKDLTWVNHSDFIISHIPYKVATTGTHHEIIEGNANKKPVLLVCPEGKELVPFWYYGFIPHKHMFGSWKALYAYLEEVDAGEHKDDYKWSFVYGLI